MNSDAFLEKRKFGVGNVPIGVPSCFHWSRLRSPSKKPMTAKDSNRSNCGRINKDGSYTFREEIRLRR